MSNHPVRRRRVSRLVQAAVLAFGTAAAVLPATSASAAPEPVLPQDDPFYQPPSPLPAGKPGDVIRSRQAKFALAPSVKSWQVLYRSEDAKGAPTAVSGTVLVPDKPWTGKGKRPVVSYTVGTRGIGDQCAPSYTMTTGLDYEQFTINDLVNKGWAVVVTDMQGLGTPGPHPYIVGRAAGRNALDVVRAAQRLPEAGLDPAGPVAVAGYSQGGSTAGWAAELAGSYAPELNLKGVSAGGVPADPVAMGKFLDGGLGAGLMFMAGLGFDAAYPELNIDGALNDAGKKLKQDFQNLCLVSFDVVPALGATVFRRIADFSTRDILNDPAWKARFNENKLGTVKPTVPVFQSHAFVDQLVGFEQGDALHRDWCKLGTNLTWKTYGAAEHATGFLRAWPDAVNFLTDRFQDKPAKSNC
ncbi:lipase family protein [Actinomadura flavalba]|uniref:lipase family protein n=1 Tax=Actinomadura flavalba TaxID=1120938 RepID=UPI00035F57C1|nr:lipase family protein [Actinomadura flavalba]